MRLLLVLACGLAAAPALALEEAPLVLNGGFELRAPLAGAVVVASGYGDGVGIGRQALGCSDAPDAVWGSSCDGQARDRVVAAEDLLLHPREEARAWLAPGEREGDQVIVRPAHASAFDALAWEEYPPGSVAYQDADGDLDREARILPANVFLYQGFASPSPHGLLPLGLVRALSFALGGAAPAGHVAFALDAFPYEASGDVPVVSHNYQLVIPAAAWSEDGGRWRADPARGILLGPYADSYLPGATAAAGAAASAWTAADEEECRAILLRFRILQLTFWELRDGTLLDDVALDVDGTRSP